MEGLGFANFTRPVGDPWEIPMKDMRRTQNWQGFWDYTVNHNTLKGVYQVLKASPTMVACFLHDCLAPRTVAMKFAALYSTPNVGILGCSRSSISDWYRKIWFVLWDVGPMPKVISWEWSWYSPFAPFLPNLGLPFFPIPELPLCYRDSALFAISQFPNLSTLRNPICKDHHSDRSEFGSLQQSLFLRSCGSALDTSARLD